MAHRIEIRRPNGEWRDVEGAVVHLYAFRYRVIVTGGIDAVLEETTSHLGVRVNGIDGEDVRWGSSPEDTAERGYVSCEVTLHASASSPPAPPEPAPE